MPDTHDFLQALFAFTQAHFSWINVALSEGQPRDPLLNEFSLVFFKSLKSNKAVCNTTCVVWTAFIFLLLAVDVVVDGFMHYYHWYICQCTLAARSRNHCKWIASSTWKQHNVLRYPNWYIFHFNIQNPWSESIY